MKIVKRPTEIAKVPQYTSDLKAVLRRSQQIKLEDALSEWAEKICQRRLLWFKQNENVLNKLEGTLVRKGFQLIMLEYMGIPFEEMEIIEETPTLIKWKSYDFCPYLEAVKILGMDSRLVCKYATELPVQVLLDILNPRLHFSRNYEVIRPYKEYCEESIEYI